MQVNPSGTLYLIPTPLSPGAIQTLSPQVIEVIHKVQHYIAEDARTARRFIKLTAPPYTLDSIQITELDKHGNNDIGSLLLPLMKGIDTGVLSEAGCPGIADPGSELVMEAHAQGIRVVPLTGPSSVVLALMASGLNGQRFQFHGYLSPKKEQLPSDLRKLEALSQKDRATQVFIETPYRNKQILDAALKILLPNTLFCIAADLSSDTEFIRTLPIREWKGIVLPDLHKRPCVFCVFAE